MVTATAAQDRPPPWFAERPGLLVDRICAAADVLRAHGKTATFVAALRRNNLAAPCGFEGRDQRSRGALDPVAPVLTPRGDRQPDRDGWLSPIQRK